ncbi:hypothetical protein [Arthrobacter sp. 131MFCol6.1]|uniref:hypothetical protein n=1 Tax=Arthrobacter sp. 131MFCol6.1 TaxID=1157944 RepID=UPI0012DBD520|nr:hypothetical protein [Arthrobacter sp. 131MFCol6.1]
MYALVLLVAFDAQDFKLPGAANVTSPVIVAATLIAGTLTAAFAVLRLRAHLLAEARGRLDEIGDIRADEKHRSDQELSLAERFSKAVELIASEQAISRIAGAHLILALGDEWPRGAQRCLDVLISHLRGLRQNDSFDNDAVDSRGMREEVYLITREVFRRLRSSDSKWDVNAGDFSGTLLAGVDLTGVGPFNELDLRGARVLDDLVIPRLVSKRAPLMSELACGGDLDLDFAAGWDALDITDASVKGEIRISGLVPFVGVDGTGLRGGQGFRLDFQEFRGNVILDASQIQGEVSIGSAEFGAGFAHGSATLSVSLVDATFGAVALRRLAPGPRLALSRAVGSVDLSNSVFRFEVDASGLDATSGFNLQGARFDEALILDEALLPSSIDIDGLVLSATARSAVQSSEFDLREMLLGPMPVAGFQAKHELDPSFVWKEALQSVDYVVEPGFRLELERRLSLLEDELPVDWSKKASFGARVMSEVSRAAAKTEATASSEHAVHTALRTSLQLTVQGAATP